VNGYSVTLIGNLTRDPELKGMSNGVKVSSLSIATNRTWKDSQGQKKEDVEYHNVIAFGKQAETLAQYCGKGDQILIEGRLQTNSWEDKNDGSKKYRTEIILENFQFGKKATQSNMTSASPELPNGVDARNHVFTTDAEREKMDKEALDAMDNILL